MKRKRWEPPPDYVPPMPYAGICPLCGASHGGSTFTHFNNRWGYYCEPHCFADKKDPAEAGSEASRPKTL